MLARGWWLENDYESSGGPVPRHDPRLTRDYLNVELWLGDLTASTLATPLPPAPPMHVDVAASAASAPVQCAPVPCAPASDAACANATGHLSSRKRKSCEDTPTEDPFF
jgi:hypothetical protein